MATFQSIVEDLLLATGASRALVALTGANGGFTAAGEAVTHGVMQIRNDNARTELVPTPILEALQRNHEIGLENDLERASPAVPRSLIDRYGARAQMLAPIVHHDKLAGFIAVHHAPDLREWSEADIDALRRAQAAAVAVLEERAQRTLATTKEDLRDAALQAILDTTRTALKVHRCTLRQNVNAAYAFPVTHESRGEGVWSLRGDFTIVQSGQPVIEKMLRERSQVVQNDTRNASADPLFHVMLKHYGDMRAQVVTPLFREDSLAAVLSIHSLKELRTWTPEETALGRSAARMLGLLIGATLA